MSITTVVCVFFAANPDEVLTNHDIGAKWDKSPEIVRKALEHAELKGWVAKDRKREGRIWKVYYRAGPRLLKEIGRG